MKEVIRKSETRLLGYRVIGDKIFLISGSPDILVSDTQIARYP